MFQAIYFLLIAVGAFAAWRSNPLYSTAKTLRFLAVIGLATAVLVGALVAVVNAVMNQPQTIALIAIGFTVMSGSIFMICAIIFVTTPAVPKLPAGAAPVHLHRRRLGSWVRRLVIALIVFGMLAAVVPGDARIVPLLLGGLLGYLGIVMTAAGYFSAVRLDAYLGAMEAAPWVHWRYTNVEWSAWTGVEAQRAAPEPSHWSWRRDGKRLLWPGAGIAVAVFLFDPGGWLWKLAYIGGIGVLFALIVEGSNLAARTAPRRIRALLSATTPESYFGSAGVLTDGVFTQWQTPGNYLLEAAVDERTPRSISLLFEEIRGGTTPVRVQRSVLIPPGGDADLPRLQQLLAALCRSARVALEVPTADTAEAPAAV